MKYPESWGRVFRYPCLSHWVERGHPEFPAEAEKKLLPYGLGRSYGDSCLNENGILLRTRKLNRILALDRESGRLRAEAGVSLDEILRLIVPAGWFLPVSPGTKFVTLGGAIANDIHGKNHHVAGTFGCHLQALELLRSDGRRLTCSKGENADWFKATIGGLGLTGLILEGEIQLKRIPSAYIALETVKVNDLDEFLDIAAVSDESFEYTVSWLDGMASPNRLGRGIFMRGNHHPDPSLGLDLHAPSALKIPFDAPNFILNRCSIKAFNFLYYHKQWKRTKRATVHYNPFFYPLDAVGEWNRIYGRRGFFQYQCLIPFPAGREPVREILSRIARSGEGSFLGVLKSFGKIASPGLLSFPRPGITLALDFPNKGPSTRRLFQDLDSIVRETRGRLYPAKDAAMKPEDFRQFYPAWNAFSKFLDPAFSSSFLRRVDPHRFSENI